MPASRHRRKGKPRLLINRKTVAGVLSSPEARVFLRKLAVVNDRLLERYGDRDDYTTDEVDAVVTELEGEGKI